MVCIRISLKVPSIGPVFSPREVKCANHECNELICIKVMRVNDYDLVILNDYVANKAATVIDCHGSV